MMNKQDKSNGLKGWAALHRRGIQWTDNTLNPIGGCLHDCKWAMPDGSVAQCYAGDVARKFTSAYPQGFEHHYWRPHALKAPLNRKEPAKIFIDSMSDMYGHWVPAGQINQVLDMMRAAHWHVFQSLTKNAPRLLQFDLPPNLWAGVSSPPDFFMGRALTRRQQEKMLHKTLEVLTSLDVPVRWISFEPLSWDVAPIVAQYPQALTWAVIGAASNGPKLYQVDPGIVQNLLDVLDDQRVPVWFKGNLEGNSAAKPWREYFPGYVPSAFLEDMNNERP